MIINKKFYTITFLLIITLLLISCNKDNSYETVINELTTEENDLYNLYFFYGNDKKSKKEYKNFNSEWESSDHMNVYNTRSYDISKGYGDLNELYFDKLNINKESAPIFILFDNKGIVLKTDNINMVISYLKDIS